MNRSFEKVELVFYARDIAPEVFDLGFLAISDPQSSEVFYRNGKIRQIKTDTALTDVSFIENINDPVLNPAGTQTGFVVRIYPLGDITLSKVPGGLYGLPSGNPFHVSIIKQEAGTEAEPTKLSHLSLTDYESGVVSKYYTFERTAGTDLDATHLFNYHHGSNATAPVWQEVETVLSPVADGVEGDYNVFLVRKERGADGALHVVEKSKKRIAVYKTGYPVELVKIEGDIITKDSTEGGTDWIKKTVQEFETFEGENAAGGELQLPSGGGDPTIDDPATFVPNWAFNKPTRIEVIRRAAPDAPTSTPHVVTYQYEANRSEGYRETIRTEPFQNQAGAKVTTTRTAVENTATSFHKVEINGVEVSNSVTTRTTDYDQLIETKVDTVRSGETLSTTTWRYRTPTSANEFLTSSSSSDSSGAVLFSTVVDSSKEGRLTKRLHPDGTLETWTYNESGNGDFLTTTHDRGSANNDQSSVVAGTRMVSVRDLRSLHVISESDVPPVKPEASFLEPLKAVSVNR